MCRQYLLRLSLLSLSERLELLVFSAWCGASAVRCFNKRTTSLTQRGLNQEATMAAESHPHPCNTPLSKKAVINWCTAHSTLAITLLSLAKSRYKEPGSGSPSGAKSRAISWQCLASTGKILQYLLQEGEGVVQCRPDSNFPVGRGGGSEDKTGLWSGEINSSCWSHSQRVNIWAIRTAELKDSGRKTRAKT